MAKDNEPSITGVVKREGQPAGSVYVRLIGPSGEFVAEEYTKDDGVFEFHVAAGTWTIVMRQPFSVSSQQSAANCSGEILAASMNQRFAFGQRQRP